MSRICEDTSLDETNDTDTEIDHDESNNISSSYQMTKHNIETESIIDETNNDINTDIDHDESPDVSSRRSPRESGIFPVRKRVVRPFDSDSDESYTDAVDVLEETVDEIYKLPAQYDLSVHSEEELDSQILKTHATDSVSDSPTRVLDAHSTDSISEAPTRVIDVPSNAEIPQEGSGSSNVAVDDDSNVSAQTGNTRLSQNFHHGATGILNSTTIHPVNENKAWRLSTNFKDIQEAKEVVLTDDSVEILSDHDSDVIEVSSDEGPRSAKKTPFKLAQMRNAARQPTLHSFFVKGELPSPRQQAKPLIERQNIQNSQQTLPQKAPKSPRITVSLTEYESQQQRVNDLELDYIKLKNMMDNINYEALPDKGELIKTRLRLADDRYKEERSKLEKMEILHTKDAEAPKGVFKNVEWKDIEAGANAVQPKTFGKTAMSTYNAQKAVTLDRLQQLHQAMQACPKEDDVEEDPKGIKVPLMPHQKRALAWVLFRENEKPSGGILADDMGLGKTLTMLSLIVRSQQLEKDDSDEENQYMGKHAKYNGGSLIVCPASLINQWSGEIERRLKRGLVSYVLYHGPKRETNARKLAEYDIVITTYAIINNEAERLSAAFKIKWRRIILDEAHIIRNYKAQTSVACCQLLAKSRWALTGTPMHNKELDMYALLKFLKCSPFDDLQVWKRWVSDKSSGGIERLHTVISSLMLRRTKKELMEKGALNCMPEKKWELINVELDSSEMSVYHKVMIFSQTLFAQFLHQRAEKNQDFVDQKFTNDANVAPNQEYHKMRQRLLKLNKVKDVSQHEILVLLLRLRQICCHASLITAMLDENREDIGSGDEESEHLNLLDQLDKLNIEDEDEYQPEASSSAVADGLSQDVRITLKEASKGHLHPSDPVFAQARASSKIKKMLEVLEERVITKSDKAIIVSQWSSYLKLVAIHLKDRGIKFDQLDGKVPVYKRMDMVDKLNNPRDSMQVLLLSLTAGGVGLNLVGANHLFLLDLHWNPQLEMQAQDRIYRVGQTKPVFVYKFMAIDTIEERIKSLQDKKLEMAEGLLTGTKQATQSKLSMEDLRMIFGM